MAELTLVSHNLCPYVQRAAIALAGKRVAFARVYVDLSNKPDWFRAISPLGKTPLLKVASGGGEQVIFESAVILEYLEETEATTTIPSCWPHFSGTGRLRSAAWSHEAARAWPKASDAAFQVKPVWDALCGMTRQPFQDVGEPSCRPIACSTARPQSPLP